MSTTYNVVGSSKAIRARPRLTVFQRWLAAFHEWRECNRVQAKLHGLGDRELMDIGIGRGEIDYVAANRDVDPRGV